MRWPWKRRPPAPSESHLAVEATQRAYSETVARSSKVEQVTEQAKRRAREAKAQQRRNHLAPTFQKAFEMRREGKP